MIIVGIISLILFFIVAVFVAKGLFIILMILGITYLIYKIVKKFME